MNPDTMMDLFQSIRPFWRRTLVALDRVGSGATLPLMLTVIFIVLQLSFNVWTGLIPSDFTLELVGASLGTGVLLYGWSVLLKKRLRDWSMLVVSLGVSSIFLAQFLYYAYAEGFLQASALQYAAQAADQRATIMTLLSPHHFFFLLPTLLALIPFVHRTHHEPTKDPLPRRRIILALMVLLLCGYSLLFVRGTFEARKLLHPVQTLRYLNNFTFAPDELVQQIGIINYSIRDLIGYAFRKTALNADDLSFALEWFQDRVSTTAQTHWNGVAKGRNVILLQVESLEQSVINERIDGKEITPTLNNLAKQGLLFRNYYTQVGPGNTADAEFVTQNSLYPLSNTVAFIDYAHNTYTALPRILNDYGYHTVVFHDDTPTFWNRSNVYPSLGYDEIRSEEYYVATGTKIQGHIGDREFFAQTIPMLAALPRPFMATVITISSHTPFHIPPEELVLAVPHDGRFTERQRAYLESIAYTDHAISTFIEGLRASDLYDNAVIVIFGDHGSFSDIAHVLGTSTDPSLGDLTTNRVPLLIIAPGTGLRGSRLTPGSHLDLAPTLTNLLGVPTPSVFIGQDLLNTTHPVVTHRDPDSQIMNTIVTPTLAYVRGHDGRFETGTCLALPQHHAIPVGDCRELFDTETASTRASDLLVRGNLLPLLFPQ